MDRVRMRLPHLLTPKLPGGVGILRADLRLAVDRPDRLELDLSLIEGARASGADREISSAIRPDYPIELELGGESLFEGEIERCAWRRGRQGDVWSSVSFASFESRRELVNPVTYFHSTDSEIAIRLARELGLEPSVDSTREIFERVERREDSLQFLRQRATAIGYHFGVTGGRLFFRADLPGEISVPRKRVSNVLSIEIEDRGRRGRGGSFSIAGDASWRPLVEFELVRMGAAWRGSYRALRCRHRMGAGGFQTEVEFLEDGLDLQAWRGER